MNRPETISTTAVINLLRYARDNAITHAKNTNAFTNAPERDLNIELAGIQNLYYSALELLDHMVKRG